MKLKLLLLILFAGTIFILACEDISVTYEYPELKECLKNRDDIIKDLIKDNCRFDSGQDNRRSVIVRCFNRKAVAMVNCKGDVTGNYKMYSLHHCIDACLLK